MTALLNKNLQAELTERAIKDPEFASKLQENPKETLSAFLNLELPEDLEISIHKDSSDALHIVLPAIENPNSEADYNDMIVADCTWGANCGQVS